MVAGLFKKASLCCYNKFRFSPAYLNYVERCNEKIRLEQVYHELITYQLPANLMAQLVEQCTGIAAVLSFVDVMIIRYPLTFLRSSTANDLLYIHYLFYHLAIGVCLYYELTTRPMPNWLDSLVDRALHRYCKDFEFVSRLGLDFFFFFFQFRKEIYG